MTGERKTERKPYQLEITPLQYRFLTAPEEEILFGGAAGGGKSFGQLADALRYALTYPGSRQLLLRRTLPELENSLVRRALSLFPGHLYHYLSSRRREIDPESDGCICAGKAGLSCALCFRRRK